MEALAARALGRGEHGDMAKPGGGQKKLPVDTMRAKLAEKADSPEALRPILEKMIGGQEDFFLTADGAPVLLSVDTLMHIQPRRSTFVPLIPRTFVRSL